MIQTLEPDYCTLSFLIESWKLHWTKIIILNFCTLKIVFNLCTIYLTFVFGVITTFLFLFNFNISIFLIQTVDLDFPNTTESYKFYCQVIFLLEFFMFKCSIIVTLHSCNQMLFSYCRKWLPVTSKNVWAEHQILHMMVCARLMLDFSQFLQIVL